MENSGAVTHGRTQENQQQRRSDETIGLAWFRNPHNRASRAHGDAFNYALA